MPTDRSATGPMEQEVRRHFPAGTVRDVAVVRHDDDPAIEPGETGVRMTVAAPGGVDSDGEFLDFFKSTHREAFARLRRAVRERFPEVTRIEIISGAEPRNRFITQLHPDERRPATELTPVMARLAAEDLETLDTLIAVGIAANRAQAIRWALARIRDRPAYARLRERAREIDELKSQF